MRKAFLLSIQWRQRHTKVNRTGLGHSGPLRDREAQKSHPEPKPAADPLHNVTDCGISDTVCKCMRLHLLREAQMPQALSIKLYDQDNTRLRARRGEREAVLEGSGKPQTPIAEVLHTGEGRPAGGSQRLCDAWVYRTDTPKLEHNTNNFKSQDRCFSVSVPPCPTPSRDDLEATGETCFQFFRNRSVWWTKGNLYLETQEYKTDPDLFPSISNWELLGTFSTLHLW